MSLEAQQEFKTNLSECRDMLGKLQESLWLLEMKFELEPVADELLEKSRQLKAHTSNFCHTHELKHQETLLDAGRFVRFYLESRAKNPEQSFLATVDSVQKQLQGPAPDWKSIECAAKNEAPNQPRESTWLSELVAYAFIMGNQQIEEAGESESQPNKPKNKNKP